MAVRKVKAEIIKGGKGENKVVYLKLFPIGVQGRQQLEQLLMNCPQGSLILLENAKTLFKQSKIGEKQIDGIVFKCMPFNVQSLARYVQVET